MLSAPPIRASVLSAPRWEKSEGEQDVSVAPSLTLEPEGRAHFCLLFMWRSWGFRICHEGGYEASGEDPKDKPTLSSQSLLPTYSICHLALKGGLFSVDLYSPLGAMPVCQGTVGDLWKSIGQCGGITDVFDVQWINVWDVSKHPTIHRIALAIRKDWALGSYSTYDLGVNRNESHQWTLKVVLYVHAVCAHRICTPSNYVVFPLETLETDRYSNPRLPYIQRWAHGSITQATFANARFLFCKVIFFLNFPYYRR